jgi:hypothetical protein
MNTRIYIVVDDHGDGTLVRAAHPQQALGYVVRSRFGVRLAHQEDLVRLLNMGQSVVDAQSPVAGNGGMGQQDELLALP